MSSEIAQRCCLLLFDLVYCCVYCWPVDLSQKRVHDKRWSRLSWCVHWITLFGVKFTFILHVCVCVCVCTEGTILCCPSEGGGDLYTRSDPLPSIFEELCRGRWSLLSYPGNIHCITYQLQSMCGTLCT